MEMNVDISNDLTSYIDDYNSEMDTILPSFTITTKKEEIWSEYLKCLTFIEFLKNNNGNNIDKDEKYGICNIKGGDDNKTINLLIDSNLAFNFISEQYNEENAQKEYLKHVESLKTCSKRLIDQLNTETLKGEIQNEKIQQIITKLNTDFIGESKKKKKQKQKTKEKEDEETTLLLEKLKNCYDFFISQAKPKLIKSYNGLLDIIERDVSDTMKSRYPIASTFVSFVIMPKRINDKMWDAFIRLNSFGSDVNIESGKTYGDNFITTSDYKKQAIEIHDYYKKKLKKVVLSSPSNALLNDAKQQTDDDFTEKYNKVDNFTEIFQNTKKEFLGHLFKIEETNTEQKLKDWFKSQLKVVLEKMCQFTRIWVNVLNLYITSQKEDMEKYKKIVKILMDLAISTDKTKVSLITEMQNIEAASPELGDNSLEKYFESLKLFCFNVQRVFYLLTNVFFQSQTIGNETKFQLGDFYNFFFKDSNIETLIIEGNSDDLAVTCN